MRRKLSIPTQGRANVTRPCWTFTKKCTTRARASTGGWLNSQKRTSHEAARRFFGCHWRAGRGTMARPAHGVKQTIPVESIVIADTLDGSEAELVHRVHPGKSLCVVSDQWT